jgi:hypothetical protein
MYPRRLSSCALSLAAAVFFPVHASAQLSEAAGIRATVPLELGRFDLRTSGSVHRIGTPIGLRTPFAFESSLRLPLTAGGFALGAGVQDGASDSLPARPFLTYAAWRSFNRIQVSVGASSHAAKFDHRIVTRRDTLGQPIGEDTVLKTALWSDVEGRIAWRLSALVMEAVVGARPRVREFSPTLWGRVGATYPLSSRLALAVAAGAEPARIGLGLPASSFLSVALRVRPWRSFSGADSTTPAAFTVQPAGEKQYHIVYVAPTATSVELSGSFSNWRPVALSSSSRPGVWEATVTLERGTHQINIRVDGGRWLPPPGLPRAEDDFNGAVGVLVVR